MRRLTEWELWAVAHETIRQHGPDAPTFAAMRADDLLKRNEPDGAHNWRMILERINQLTETPQGRVQ